MKITSNVDNEEMCTIVTLPYISSTYTDMVESLELKNDFIMPVPNLRRK